MPSPPLYCSSCPAPSYSMEPLSDEQTLEQNLRHNFRPSARATFTKKVGHTTVILRELEETVVPPAIPLYSRNSVVNGEIHLDASSKDICAVVVKLQGQVDLLITEGGSKSKKLFSDKYTLWTSDGNPGRSCPTILPFSCPFPAAFKDGPRTRTLPPSYRVAFHGPPGLCATCVYTLVVGVSKKRHRYLLFWTGSQRISIPLNHLPRTRPHRPFLQNSMLSTIKPSPEEWHQVVATMRTRPISGLKPIECHLFIPSAQIYGISDTIPFHVQFIGPLSSLLAFLPSYSDSSSSSPKNKPIIRVFLLRQILVEVHGEKAWRNCEIGDGKLRALPPVAGVTMEGEDESLGWEGEVQCTEGVSVGGFNIGKLVVKDFIVLATKPSHPGTSPLLEFQYAHPIRFVTDSWEEISGPLSD